MAKEMNLGDFKVKARQIGNGYLSNDDFNDYFFKTADDCFSEFVNEEMPKQIVIGDRLEALDCNKSFSWSDVIGNINQMIRESGEDFIIGNTDIELEIKVKAIVHEAD